MWTNLARVFFDATLDGTRGGGDLSCGQVSRQGTAAWVRGMPYLGLARPAQWSKERKGVRKVLFLRSHVR